MATQNPYGIDPDDKTIARIPLSKDQWAIIDRADLPLLQGRIWSAVLVGNTFYAITHIRTPQGKRSTLTLHRCIMGTPKGVLIDHENHDGLDCRRSNLRIATHQQNAINRLPQKGGTSKLKGVSWDRRAGKWSANITWSGNLIHLGLHDSETEAGWMYDFAASVIHAGWACTNSGLGLIPTANPFVPGHDLWVPA